MKTIRWGGIAAAVLLAVAPVWAEENQIDNQAVANAVPNEVLVQWKEQLASTTPVTTLQVSDVDAALTVLSQDPRVEFAEPNYKRFLAVMPDDPYYDSQWHLATIEADSAWDYTSGNQDIVVAVVDTGIDLDHPDIVDNLWSNSGEIADNSIDDDGNGYVDDVNGWDFIADDNDPSAHPGSSNFNDTYVRHGTHVAGIIGATGNNITGVTGVNWDVSIMPLKIFNDDGESNISAVTAAITYAIDNGADVINMSYGGTSLSELEQAVMADAADAGIILVAAAGNELTDLNEVPYYPICYPDIIGVGATDSSDAMAWFSNYGTDCVDLAAPGDTILSTYYTDEDASLDLTDEYGYMSGTSMATPVVSGLAALMLSADSTLTAREVATTLTSTADDINISELGAGRINAGTSIGTTVSNAGPDAVMIKAYRSATKQQRITANVRTNDATPYFYWSEPSSPAAVVGYYVYFGRDKVDPTSAGLLQSNRSYIPVGKVTGNEVPYRLRVKTLDAEDRLSDLGQFVYLVDTFVRRPVWQSITPVQGGAELRWYKAKSEHIVGYKVYRATERSGKYHSMGVTVTQPYFLDTTVTPDKRYYYKVRAIDDLGNVSGLSEINTVKL